MTNSAARPHQGCATLGRGMTLECIPAFITLFYGDLFGNLAPRKFGVFNTTGALLAGIVTNKSNYIFVNC